MVPSNRLHRDQPPLPIAEERQGPAPDQRRGQQPTAASARANRVNVGGTSWLRYQVRPAASITTTCLRDRSVDAPRFGWPTVHISIEIGLRYFDHGIPAFRRIDGEIRRLVIEDVAASDLPGLVCTFVWVFDVPGEQAFVDERARPFRARGARAVRRA